MKTFDATKSAQKEDRGQFIQKGTTSYTKSQSADIQIIKTFPASIFVKEDHKIS